MCRIDVQALEGDSKAIKAEHDVVEFKDSDDDATQMQKAAAVIFGNSSASLLHWSDELRHARCMHFMHIAVVS